MQYLFIRKFLKVTFKDIRNVWKNAVFSELHFIELLSLIRKHYKVNSYFSEILDFSWRKKKLNVKLSMSYLYNIFSLKNF